MKQHLKRKVKNVIVNKTKVLMTNNSKSSRTKSNKSSTSETDNKRDHKQKSVIILGDSMIKHVNGWEVLRKLQETVKYM